MTAAATEAETKTGFLSTAYVWIAILIFASANSIVLVLVDIGAEAPVDGRNPISFCNVLFAGNFIAFVAMIAVYWRQWTKENLRKLTYLDWGSLVFLASITGALVPSLMFLALENSSVTNAVLVGRIEPFILIFLSTVFLSERLDVWPTIGAVVAFTGVIVTFYLKADGMGIEVGKGELQAAAAAALTALSTIIAKVRLKHIALGIFTVVRTGLGTIIFLIVTIYLLGLEHFVDLTSPTLWKWMLFYGAVIVVGGQFFWFTGIKSARTSDISLASSFTPVAGVMFAFMLLGEVPDAAVMIGGVFIVLGIAIGQIGNLSIKLPRPKILTAGAALEREREVSFKGI